MNLIKSLPLCLIFIIPIGLFAQYKKHTPSEEIIETFKIDIDGVKSIRANFFEFVKHGDFYRFRFDGIYIAEFFNMVTRRKVYSILGRPDEFKNGDYVYLINESTSNCKRHIIYGCPSPMKIPPIGNEETPNTVSHVIVYYDIECDIGSDEGYEKVTKMVIRFYPN